MRFYVKFLRVFRYSNRSVVVPLILRPSSIRLKPRKLCLCCKLVNGPDRGTLQGKTVKKTAAHVPSFSPILLPTPIVDDHKDVTLATDFFFVQGLPFIHTISRKIKFRTVKAVKSRTKGVILKETMAAVALYEARGFDVVDIHADMDFECIKDDVRPILMNLNAHDDHVGEVERSIRTIKERVRADVHSMPFKRLPKIMVVELVNRAVLVLNQFPALDGVSDTLSPLTIMTGKPNPDFHNMKIEFGSYAQVFEENDPTNTTKSRTTGAIALNPTGNAQGDYYFMSLNTGRRLARTQWTLLPMPDTVIAAVESRAEAERQPLIIGGCPLFEWRPANPVQMDNAEEEVLDIDEDAADNVLDVDDDEDYDPATDSDQGTDDEDYDQYEGEYDSADFDDSNEEESSDGGNEEASVDETGTVPDDVRDETGEEQGEAWPSEDDDVFIDNVVGTEDVSEETEEAGTVAVRNELPTDAGAEYVENEGEPFIVPRYHLRERRQRDYSHRLDHQMDGATNEQSYEPQRQLLQATQAKPVKFSKPKLNENDRNTPKYIFGHIMTQMTATAGIKKHGQRAVDALLKEFCQLDDKSVFAPVKAGSLTGAQKSAALRAINLIKEKRDGGLKGRSCADGSSQRALYTKEQSASPTVSTDALMLSLMVDAKERRDVATADVVGAYLLADMDEFVLLKLSGASVDIMCTVNAKYRVFVTIENGKKVLYLQLLKALYGCVRSALLWYELFSGTLKEMGFELNPYDPCVANKMIEGSQCTIAWYVDDNKISHAKASVVTSVIERIEEKFGKMTVTRGKSHVFLGMSIRFLGNGDLSIGMKEYVKEAILEFGDDVSKQAATPARKNVFEVEATSPLLTKDKSEVYHKVVAKLLYVSHRGRPDIQLAVAFMCTRVSCSTDQDWLKLKRLLQYLNRTLDDVLTIGADSLTRLMTWVDAAYGVHRDMKSHTGGAMSLGRGAIMCKSSKQKLNTKSSTEAELVGASDYLPNTIWAKMFLEAQGYKVQENLFLQDNQSAMKLEVNGRASCGQKSRHIDIRYFFMKDRIKTEGIDVVYCPTEEMLADFFTKPLQGSLFMKFKRVLMGEAHISTLNRTSLVAPVKERVEESDKSRNENRVTQVTPENRLPGTDQQTDEECLTTNQGIKETYASILQRSAKVRRESHSIG